MFIKWTIIFLNSVTLTGENQGKWKKYLVKIEKAVEDYKDCTQGDCSCHRRYREFTINYFYQVWTPSNIQLLIKH